MSRVKRVVKIASTPADPYVMNLLGKISEGKRVLSYPER